MNKPLNTSPIRPAVANLIFRVALGIVPQASRDWLEDMRLEAHFVEGYGARLRWALGALLTALRFRLVVRSLTRPQMFAAASALTVAAISLVIVMPQTGLNLAPSPVLEQEETTALADEATGSPAQSPAEPLLAVPMEEEAERVERSRDSDITLSAEARAVAAPSKATEAEAAPLDQEEALIPVASSDAEADALGFADMDGSSDNVSLTSSPIIPAAVTELLKGPVVLETQSAVWLELYEGPAGNRQLLAKGLIEAGKSFELSLPFYIQTEDAAAIKVTIEKQTRTLGPKGVALGRLFRLPR